MRAVGHSELDTTVRALMLPRALRSPAKDDTQQPASAPRSLPLGREGEHAAPVSRCPYWCRATMLRQVGQEYAEGGELGPRHEQDQTVVRDPRGNY